MLQSYAELPETLQNSTKKNTKSKYADKYQKTFEKLKVILTNSETKTYFISDGKTKVIAEA